MSNTTLRILSVTGGRGFPPPFTKFLAKKDLQIWGVPPSPPLRNFFSEKGVTDLHDIYDIHDIYKIHDIQYP